VAHFLVVCTTHRDRRELARIASGHRFTWHEYATDALEDLVAPRPRGSVMIPDPCAEVDRLVGLAQSAAVDGVVSTDDYPGSALAAITAECLQSPGTPAAINLLCQHKYLCRVAQREIVPEAVPRFALVDGAWAETLPPPYFVKPVKSFFSAGAVAIHTDEDRPLISRAMLPASFVDPFNKLLRAYSPYVSPPGDAVAESLLCGSQVTVEGYACHGHIEVLGIVDALMYPNTIAFRRFEYPSRLPGMVQKKIADLTVRLMRGLGYAHGMFNVEMMYEPESGAVFVIEINPRMSSQFADLFEKVDGINTYQILLDLTLNRKPRAARESGRYAASASCVFRTFEDAWVERVPAPDDVAKVIERFPDARVEIHAQERRWLSEQMQDSCSYRYGIVNLGGCDQRDIADQFRECRRLLPFVFRAPRHQARHLATRAGVLLAALTVSSAGCGSRIQSVLDPAGVHAARISTLWWLMLMVLSATFVLVLLFLYRALARAPHLKHFAPPRIEPAEDSKTWRGVGAAIAVTVVTLFGLLVASLLTGSRVAALPAPAGAITIEVTGRQWWWEIRYPHAQNDQVVTTANEIHVPVGVPFVIKSTSSDVIHSFWVPALHGKRDVLPGRVNTFWLQADRAGTYRGQCAEFCGLQHAHMAFYVIAEPREEFARWLQAQRVPAAEPATDGQRRGQQVFLSSPCVMCHTVRGTPAAAQKGPDLTHLASRRFIAAGTLPNTRGHLAGWILDSQGIKPGSRMPPNPLAPADLHALLEYLENLR
jgi:cytochrome c oxidase subunit 2